MRVHAESSRREAATSKGTPLSVALFRSAAGAPRLGHVRVVRGQRSYRTQTPLKSAICVFLGQLRQDLRRCP